MHYYFDNNNIFRITRNTAGTQARTHTHTRTVRATTPSTLAGIIFRASNTRRYHQIWEPSASCLYSDPGSYLFFSSALAAAAAAARDVTVPPPLLPPPTPPAVLPPPVPPASFPGPIPTPIPQPPGPPPIKGPWVRRAEDIVPELPLPASTFALALDGPLRRAFAAALLLGWYGKEGEGEGEGEEGGCAYV